MKLYCHHCNLEYDTIMGDLECPLCGRELEKERRANRTYTKHLMTLRGAEQCENLKARLFLSEEEIEEAKRRAEGKE